MLANEWTDVVPLSTQHVELTMAHRCANVNPASCCNAGPTLQQLLSNMLLLQWTNVGRML